LERAFPPSRLSLVGKLLIDQTLGAAAFNGVLLVMLYWLEHGFSACGNGIHQSREKQGLFQAFSSQIPPQA